MSHEEVIQILTEMHDDCSERIDCAGCAVIAEHTTELCMIIVRHVGARWGWKNER